MTSASPSSSNRLTYIHGDLLAAPLVRHRRRRRILMFAMGTGITTRQSVTIDAPAAEVWRALTTPERIRQWFFGVDTQTDWAEGSPIVHRGEYQGTPYEDRGTILRIEPERLLVHTHWSSVSGLPDLPEHYQEVTWALAERGGRTELTVSETNLPSEAAKEASEQGWQAALGALRDLLER